MTHLPEDDIPTKPLSMPPVRVLSADQLDKLADITGSFAAMAKDPNVVSFARSAYGNVVSVLTAFIVECQAPPPVEELRKDLEVAP